MITWILKRAFVVLLIAGVVGVAIFAGFKGFELFQKFLAESLAIGTVPEIDESETVIATFDFGNDYSFPIEGDLKRDIDPIEFDGDINDYVVRLNGYACDVISFQTGLAHVATKMLFTTLEGQDGGSVSFNITITFGSLGGKISVGITAVGADVYDFLNNYVYINGLKFEVCLKEAPANV